MIEPTRKMTVKIPVNMRFMIVNTYTGLSILPKAYAKKLKLFFAPIIPNEKAAIPAIRYLFFIHGSILWFLNE